VLGILLASLGFACGCRRSQEPAPGAGAATDESGILRLRNVAVAYLEAERHDEATEAFDELIRLLPGEPMAHANRGLIALRANDLEQAESFLETAGRLAPDDPDIAILRSQAAVFRGRDELARARLEAAVEANPDHLRARWALVDVLRRDPSAAAGDAVLGHLETLVERAPENVVVRLALARGLLEQGRLPQASEHVRALSAQGVARSPQARQFLAGSTNSIESQDAAAARSAVIALNNVLKPSRAWQDSLAEVKGPPVPVAAPLWDFREHRVSELEAGPRMLDVVFRDTAEALGPSDVGADAATMVVTAAERLLVTAVGDRIEVRRSSGDGPYERAAEIALYARVEVPAVAVSGLRAVDLDNDRQSDLLCGLTDGSVRLWVRNDRGARPSGACVGLLGPLDRPTVFGALLPWDADQDGDLDVLVARAGVRAALLRNNGNGTFTEAAPAFGIGRDGDPAFIDAAVADLDEDGDLDLVALGADRTLIRFENKRSGTFTPLDLPLSPDPLQCLAVADLDNDGWLDLASVTSEGSCLVGRNRRGVAFDVHVAGETGQTGHPGAMIRCLDFDNDGWQDLLVLADGRPHLFRNGGGFAFHPMPEALPRDAGDVKDVQVLDHDGDGDLDLFVARRDGGCTVWDNDGGNRHGWQKVQLEAIVKGGQRNNAFGVGGFVEVRAGRAYQKRMVQGPVTHFGLGALGPPDAIRVVWPNGVPQNILHPEPNELLVEKQTLKGSCPFLLADNGRHLEFVTDLLWRSPLGMRINATTVAPGGTTQDYVKIEARQLRPRDGRYEISITAALWETIFVDEVELWAVDHPATLEIYVDERFVAPVFPPFEIHVVDALRAPRAAVDDRGRDVLHLIEARDGRRLGGFAKGRYQGIAEMHDLVVDLGPWQEPQTVRLIASGWIMPTTSSINLAISQGRDPPPTGLGVSVADGSFGTDRWIEVIPDAGFPAGKLKTIVLDLSGRFPSSDHRVRLRTNLEIYWDRIAVALGDPPFQPRRVPLAMITADLERFGFPEMVRRDELAPEVPDYNRRTRSPRWRDLVGYYTRYGNVAELLAETDDRYVIMNAGDGIRLAFEAGPPPPDGWIRDFILFSDGWVKDGDWNTAASMTVGPLPHHNMSAYPYPDDETPATLEPGHSDWQRYHTRFVTPDPYRDRMRP
jgi:Flp pilus assembly protein TadD